MKTSAVATRTASQERGMAILAARGHLARTNDEFGQSVMDITTARSAFHCRGASSKADCGPGPPFCACSNSCSHGAGPSVRPWRGGSTRDRSDASATKRPVSRQECGYNKTVFNAALPLGTMPAGAPPFHASAAFAAPTLASQWHVPGHSHARRWRGPLMCTSVAAACSWRRMGGAADNCPSRSLPLDPP